jgi:hypothetical protein
MIKFLRQLRKPGYFQSTYGPGLYAIYLLLIASFVITGAIHANSLKTMCIDDGGTAIVAGAGLFEVAQVTKSNKSEVKFLFMRRYYGCVR